MTDELLKEKKEADKEWEQVMKQAANGVIDRLRITNAMDRCNKIDKLLIEKGLPVKE